MQSPQSSHAVSKFLISMICCFLGLAVRHTLAEQAAVQGILGGPGMWGLLWPPVSKPLVCELEPGACCFLAPGCLQLPCTRAGGFNGPGGE